MHFFWFEHIPSLEHFSPKKKMVDSFNFSYLFNTSNSYSYDGFNVDKFIDDMDPQVFMLFQVALVVEASLEEFFIAIELVPNVN
jgi:hypothetical protein